MQLLRRIFLPRPIYYLINIGYWVLLLPFYIFPAILWCLFAGFDIAQDNFVLGLAFVIVGLLSLYVVLLEVWRWKHAFSSVYNRSNTTLPKKDKKHSLIESTLLHSINSTLGKKTAVPEPFASEENWMFYDVSVDPPVMVPGFRELPPAGMYVHTVIEYKLKRALPTVIFDSKKLRGLQYFRIASNVQRISFEGNFDDSFQSYCPAGYTVDTLAFITPEVIEAILRLDGYDFEIVGDSLFCIAPFLENNELTDFKLSCDVLFEKLNDHIQNYRDSHVEKRIPSSYENHPLSAHIVKAPSLTWPIFIVLCILTMVIFTIIEKIDQWYDYNAWYFWLSLLVTIVYGITFRLADARARKAYLANVSVLKMP